MNSSEYEYGPTLSGDGRYLYFTSHRAGSGTYTGFL
ncbi:MAG: PD40 domain-containing protein [Gemmatimonadetes bacterium]|nr:PD40 domain-containing protein [Gemmatimonadota bacterium]